MARSPPRTVGGISYDAALSDGISPNMATMGREVLLPASLIVQPPEEPSQSQPLSRPSFAKTCATHMRPFAARPSALRRLNRIVLDEHVKGPPLALNQLVWLYWPRPLLRTRSRKLTRSWTGPWRIVELKPRSSSCNT